MYFKQFALTDLLGIERSLKNIEPATISLMCHNMYRRFQNNANKEKIKIFELLF